MNSFDLRNNENGNPLFVLLEVVVVVTVADLIESCPSDHAY